MLRSENHRRHDGRDGDDEQPQPGGEEEGDEGAEGWRHGKLETGDGDGDGDGDDEQPQPGMQDDDGDEQPQKYDVDGNGKTYCCTGGIELCQAQICKY